MGIHNLCPVLLQRRSQALLLPGPLQIDRNGISLQLLLQQIQLTSLLKREKERRGVEAELSDS